MKNLNLSLLLLAGIAANVLLACGGEGVKDDKAPYTLSDTSRPAEYKNKPDTLSPGMEDRENEFETPGRQ